MASKIGSHKAIGCPSSCPVICFRYMPVGSYNLLDKHDDKGTTATVSPRNAKHLR